MVIELYCSLTFSCVVDECTAYMVVCEPTYPHILAFSFLDELKKEFNVLYTPSVVKSVRRPYAFIEFGKNLIMLFNAIRKDLGLQASLQIEKREMQELAFIFFAEFWITIIFYCT